jgi:hypothetical protein
MKVNEILTKALIRRELFLYVTSIIIGLTWIFELYCFTKTLDPKLGAVVPLLIGQMLFLLFLTAILQISSGKAIEKEMDKNLDDLRFALKAQEEVLKSLKK